MTRPLVRTAGGLVAAAMIASAAEAQSLGTFRWQLQPFCNVVTVNVTQQGAVYTVDGYDDQCGAAQRAPLVGLATPNPDGSIGLGLNIVTVPGGRAVHVEARISLATLSGPWSDGSGHAGTFAFGASSGGSPRPAPATEGGGTVSPPTFALQPDGGFLARGTINVGTIPASGNGTRMMWFPNKAAFRVGTVTGTQWDDANVGGSSIAMGLDTIADGGASTALGSHTTASGGNSTALGAFTLASGGNSTALGLLTTASGSASTAVGNQTLASGVSSTAMGDATTAAGNFGTAIGHLTSASGDTSTAMGWNTIASGRLSTAMGSSTRASGDLSTAIGVSAVASGVNSMALGTTTTAAGLASMVLGVRAATTASGDGSFVYGDRSTGGSGSIVTAASPNQFMVRAAGGFFFYTSPVTTYDVTTPGVQLQPGAFAWSSVSDANAKENFRDLSDDDVLGRIAAMPVRQWNYKAQGSAILHIGPTAQDFHGAFGLGEDPLRISTIDADGVALAAVHALESRTRQLRDDNRALREQVEALTRAVDALLARRD
jgi:hypothetical protein